MGKISKECKISRESAQIDERANVPPAPFLSGQRFLPTLHFHHFGNFDRTDFQKWTGFCDIHCRIE